MSAGPRRASRRKKVAATRRHIFFAALLLFLAAVGIIGVRFWTLRPEILIAEPTRLLLTPVATTSPPVVEEPVKAAPPAPGENLLASSFSDLFSGVGWIDEAKTTLWHDRAVTALTFPPVLNLQKVESESELAALRSLSFIELEADGSNTRCLPVRQAGLGTRCLRENDPSLFFSNSVGEEFRPVALPSELDGKVIERVSIGALETKWLVGATTREGATYLGRVFYFDGSSFSEVLHDAPGGNPFVSEYQGVFGFGGNDTDWLAIYGAHEGIAMRVREAGLPAQAGDKRSYERLPDTFFGIRVMSGGFQPVALRAEKDSLRNWYVFSLTPVQPKLIKLFQNRTDAIAGALDITIQALPSDAQGATAALLSISSSEVTLVLKLTGAGGEQTFWKLTDRGFDKSKKGEILSLNVNNYLAEIRSAHIAELDFSPVGATVEFFLSNDGNEWLTAGLNQGVVFPQKEGRRLLWRAELLPDNDPHTSPFLDRLRLDYVAKFL